MIQEAGLDPSRFEWEPFVEGGNRYEKLIHKDANCVFVFGHEDHKRGQRYCRIRPAGAQLSLATGWFNHGQLLDTVRQWLKLVKEDVEAPDLWGQLAAYTLEIPEVAIASLDEAPLLEADQKRIALAVAATRERVGQEATLTKEQVGIINEKLDYLVESSKRLGLKDWANAALGGLVSAAFGAALDGTAYKRIIEPIWNLIVSGVRLLNGSG
jgi:hypothetical protein